MLDNESTDKMLTHFSKITNGLSSLGDEIDKKGEEGDNSSSESLRGQGDYSQRA